MSEQKRYYIGRMHRHSRFPGVVYACLYDRTLPEGENCIISADMEYILDAVCDRYPGQVDGVIEDSYYGKSAQQTEAQATQVLVQDRD